jgi:hypothetical protein
LGRIEVGVAGVRPLRRLLDRDTFVLSREELERLFLPLAREAGLPLPLTQVIVNEYEADHVRRILTETAARL